MIKKKKFIVIDTETCGLYDNPRKGEYADVYDIAWRVIDKQGQLYAEFSGLVEETVTDAKKMMGAFFAKKIFHHYIPMLDANKIRLYPWWAIIKRMQMDIEQYECTVVSAYNLPFDSRVIASTQKKHNPLKKVLPYKMDTLCLMAFSQHTILNQVAYKNFADRHNLLTATQKFRSSTAESTYKYITGDTDFIESHTALEDVKIECEILQNCLRQKKRIPYNSAKIKWRHRRV